MQSITRGIALCILTGVVITGAPVYDTFADESAMRQAATDPAKPPSPEASRPKTETGDVQERGVIRNLDPGRFSIAPSVLPAPGPPAATVPNRGEVGPLTGVNTLPDRYQTPTANLTAVANALKLQHNSLVKALILPPNIRLTAPVNITVEYLSPSSPREMITHTYAAETGMRLVHHDGIGDGKPRRVFMGITLAERPITGNGAHFVMNWQVELDPLFNVEISSMRFKLLEDCDWVGRSEVGVSWDFPGKTEGSKSFSARAGNLITIPDFAWSGTGISARDMLLRPVVRFGEHDPTCLTPLCFVGDTGAGQTVSSPIPLIPGQTGVVTETLKARMESCRAEFSYPILYVPYKDPAVSQPQTTIVMDNRALSVQRLGAWATFTGAGFYGFDSESSSAAPPLKQFRWIPTIPTTGLYNVYVWWPNNTGRSTTVPYTVHHADGDTTKTFNQRTGGNGWVLHGRYNVRAGTSAYVEVSNANGAAGADAVKFEFAGPSAFNQRLNKLGKQPNEFLPLNPKALSPGKIFRHGVDEDKTAPEKKKAAP